MSASHGNTPAAWTAVAVMFTGFLVSGIALPLSMPWLFFVGLVVVVLGVVVGKVMQMMGLGQTVSYKDDRSPDYDEPDSNEPASDERHEPDRHDSDRHDPEHLPSAHEGTTR